MARKIRDSKLESRSARLKLQIRRKPYTGPSLGTGIILLYRRNTANGTWVVKVAAGHGAYWTRAFADADDYENSDPLQPLSSKRVLTFFEAQDRGKQLARGGDGGAPDSDAPVTVGGALDDYETDLKSRNADVYNAQRPRVHLTTVLLAKPVQLLTAKELKRWRNSLLHKIAPATINRLSAALCAALELAVQHDRRIQNSKEWKIGLAEFEDAEVARNVVLSDDKVRDFIAGAYARNETLGLLTDTLAVTGARPGQAARLLVEDLKDDPLAPRLTMPRSGKGGSRKRAKKKQLRYSVPISVALAAKLKEAAQGRMPDDLLLVRVDGTSWGKNPSDSYRADIREVVASIGLDPDNLTMYSLRHSSIVRMLRKNINPRIVAAHHDTSVEMIEKNYSRHITEHVDDVARAALLEPQEPKAAPANNVIPLAHKKS
jgi:integrase